MKKVLTVLVAVVAMATVSASAFAGCGSNIGRNATTNPQGPTGNGGGAGGTVAPGTSGTANAGFNHSHH